MCEVEKYRLGMVMHTEKWRHRMRYRGVQTWDYKRLGTSLALETPQLHTIHQWSVK